MSDRVAQILLDSFSKILIPGLTATIPLALISFAIALVIAIAVALVQYARVPVLTQLVRFYIWIIRGTPLLVQLYVVFYGLPDFGIVLDPFPRLSSCFPSTRAPILPRRFVARWSRCRRASLRRATAWA